MDWLLGSWVLLALWVGLWLLFMWLLRPAANVGEVKTAVVLLVVVLLGLVVWAIKGGQ